MAPTENGASGAPNGTDGVKKDAWLDFMRLDQSKLASAVASEQGEVFVLQWLSKLEKTLKSADRDLIDERQAELEKSLLALTLPTCVQPQRVVPKSPNPQGPGGSSATAFEVPSLTAPHPGRPSRYLLSRCFILVFGSGESRSLFDILQTLLRASSDDPAKLTTGAAIGTVYKGAFAKEGRVAAFYVTGEIFGALGQHVMSLFNDLVTTALQVAKSTFNPVILRYHALLCLKKVLRRGSASLSDQVGKEMLRSLRQGLADKAGAVVRGYAECIMTLNEQTTHLASRNEVEAVLACALKALETADFPTKRVVSELCAMTLALTQQESAPLPTAATKSTGKKKKGDTVADVDDGKIGIPTSAEEASTFRRMMTPTGMFEQLSTAYFRSPTSRKLQAALFDVYAALLTRLGAEWVHLNYELIFKHFAADMPAMLRSNNQRTEFLFLRSGVRILLREFIGERMLGEQGQVAAIQQICTGYIKRWPTLTPGHFPPAKFTLAVALSECTGLLTQLGSTPPQVQDALYAPLIRCASHPSLSVQMSAALCLRTYCDANPMQLTSTITHLLSLLNKDLKALVTGSSSQRVELLRSANGHARGLAAVLCLIPKRPLYTAFDVSVEVLSLSIKLLKDSGNHDLHVSAVQIQVAWTLLSALMSLGPNFVRMHQSQLLTIWRNALPKPTSKDTASSNSGRSEAEWGFLLHVRECTLGCILSFLFHNASELVNLDTSRRIVALLSHALAFVDAFSAQHPNLLQEQTPGVHLGGLTLLDREFLLRRRLMQCFTVLAENPAMEPLESGLLMVALKAFAEPDRYIGSATQAAISASAGNFTSVWSLADGYAFGVSCTIDVDTCSVGQGVQLTPARSRKGRLNRDICEAELDNLQYRPVFGAPEHDIALIYLPSKDSLAAPASTSLVDASIEVFARLFPFQQRNSQIAALEGIAAYLRSPRLDRNPGRQMAVQVNAMAALLGSLRVAATPSANGRLATGFSHEKVSSVMREILQTGLLSTDTATRNAASEAYGRFAAIAGSQLSSVQVQFLVDQVVSNRDPDARAGCALAFGSIYSSLGGLAAGPLTKTVVNVLFSLARDPHPTVHYFSLQALQSVVEAASLSYTQYVTSTLGMLVKLYMQDTHEPEGGSVGSVNLRGDLPAHQSMCRIIDAMLGVLGPDLADSTKIRELLLAMMAEMQLETEDGVVIEATKAYQHFSLFAPGHIDTVHWIGELRRHLVSPRRPFKACAMNALYQLVQKDALTISKVGGDRLAEDFFAELDKDPLLEGVRDVTLSWLRQTAAANPRAWVDLCQRIISTGKGVDKGARPTASLATTSALQDEESASLGIDDGGSSWAASQTSRWRTRLFALQCVHEIFLTLRNAGRLEHFRSPPTEGAFLMSNRVTDLIKMAFIASTASNTDIRQEGLVLLRDVVENFKLTPDPDFPEALMLEQHQAPISSALMPAFTLDSTPEVLASAVQVCASFVGSGIIKDTAGMGRILKQLVAALEASQQVYMSSLGDVQNLTPNASVMLKVAVFTAWAELYLACGSHDYLDKIVKPHASVLVPSWTALLREYARLHSTDVHSAALGRTTVGMNFSAALDSQYAGLSREVVLPYFETSWWRVLHAFSVVMRSDEAQLLEIGPDSDKDKNDAASEEPSSFFFLIYGLAFEILASTSSWKDSMLEARVKRVALQTLQSLSHAKYAGSALLDEALFDELSALCHRMIMTESVTVQIGVMQMLSTLIASYGGRIQNREMVNKCLRSSLYVIDRCRSAPGTTLEKAKLFTFAFSSALEISDLHEESKRNDLLAILVHLYSDLLRDELIDVDLITPTLPSLKALCEHLPSGNLGSLQKAVHGLTSRAVETINNMRSRSAALATRLTKANLLALTVVVTALPSSITLSRAVLEEYTYLISHRISTDDGEISLTASTCARSILLASGRSNVAIRYCAGQLLAGLISGVARRAEELRATTDKHDDKLALVGEEIRVIMGLFGTLPSSIHPALMLTVVPTLLLLCSDEEDINSTSAAHSFAVSQLVTLASTHSAAFKVAAAGLDEQRRSLLESSVRRALLSGAGAHAGRGGAVKPKAGIALRSFGSG
ncbi:hypothetical protein K437DRAFT_268128 [Tilletiaria anomala UBC 951]|uniref:LAA1-like C-terminal TPR repeats domain-containing protein n=1 Tax=Tilletiaria anomala (strain ATCC 24038 / CBS 436.72 / UBC 951) TaxID=1037660 RepID=A0A066W6T0_TILAU|nr:uncharacterized protein K437DRAFT_268128 [Tilletiaria anomala UBC 951]KDN46480.1 hypothetical protein K437DRAFT_268128 [Tilletiaria anomala UBC 951]